MAHPTAKPMAHRLNNIAGQNKTKDNEETLTKRSTLVGGDSSGKNVVGRRVAGMVGAVAAVLCGTLLYLQPYVLFRHRSVVSRQEFRNERIWIQAHIPNAQT